MRDRAEAILSRAQARMFASRTMEVFFRFGLAFLTFALVFASVYRIFAGHLPPVVFGWLGLGIFLVGWLGWTAAAFPRRLDVARQLDRLANFKDRFVTYLDFKLVLQPSACHELAIKQNAAEIVKLNLPECCPIRAPRLAVWLIVPVICFVSLWTYDRFSIPSIVVDAQLEKVLAGKSEELKKISEGLKKEAEVRKLNELQRLAQEMKSAAEQIKPHEGKSAEEMKKNALLEWSRLESKLAELSKSATEASSADLKQLADSLEQDPATANLAKMLRQQNLTGAMEELESMMGKAVNDPNAARELQEMAQKMGQLQMSSEQMAELTKQMRQAAGGSQRSNVQQAAQSFSRMLLQMEKGRQQNQLASRGLSAMQMAKSELTGLGPPKGIMSGEGKKEGFGQGGDESRPDQKEGTGIGTGTVKDIFGDPTKISVTKSAAKVEGEAGEGASFENILRGAGEKTASTVEYRELFNNYAPEAEEAVFKENIPLGSKYYIKRYFEGIRPQR